MDTAVKSLAIGPARAIVSGPCRSLLLSTHHKSCPTYGPVRGHATGCHVCFYDVKKKGGHDTAMLGAAVNRKTQSFVFQTP